MRPISRLWRAAFLGSIVGVAFAGAAAADDEPSGIVVTPPVVRPGDEINIQGTFLWTELGVSAALLNEDGASREVGSGTTNADGSLSLAVAVPADLPAGRYTVRVTNAAGESVDGSVVVQPEAPILPILAIVAGAVAVILVGLSATRRRVGG